MKITSEESDLYRSQLINCCHDFDAKNCKCPECGAALAKVVHNIKKTQLKCDSCFYVHTCGDLGAAKEYTTPGAEGSTEKYNPPTEVTRRKMRP